MSKIEDLYVSLVETLHTKGTLSGEGNYLEVVGLSLKPIEFNNLADLERCRADNDLMGLYSQYHPKVSWNVKSAEEEMHYKKLSSSLLHSMNENTYYFKSPILESRRFIALSSDCISFIQIIFREAKTEIIVHFRSSELFQLLPIDLDFIFSLPYTVCRYLLMRSGASPYEDLTKNEVESIEWRPIEFLFSFGSLHVYGEDKMEMIL